MESRLLHLILSQIVSSKKLQNFRYLGDIVMPRPIIGFFYFSAISNTAYPLGPVLGFTSAAVFLGMPENLKGKLQLLQILQELQYILGYFFSTLPQWCHKNVQLFIS